MEPARLLADLNDDQRAAVTSTAAPLRILAGAGSGKTRVLTRRIGHRCATGDADPRYVLALTFTRKAAGELRQRLRQLGLRDMVAAGTFHGVAWAQLQARWGDRGVRTPELITRKAPLMAKAMPGGLARKPGAVRDVTSEIEWATARLVEPGGYAAAMAAAGRAAPIDPAAVDATWLAYVEHKRTQRSIDFDDLLRLWRRDLEGDPDFAAVQRYLFRHLFVDEFQDVNPAQHALLAALVGDSVDLCVVGDPNQAIYAWNGADAGFLVDFEQRWPGAGTVRLVDSYRSTPQVLRTANAVLRAAVGADAEVAALVPHRPDGPEPTITAAADDAEEARLVARAVRDAHRPGGRWFRQAVLVRTNAQLPLLEQALQAAGIPSRVRGGGALLDQPEVKAALRTVRDHPGPFDAVVAELESAAAGLAGDLAPGAAPDSRAANVDALARLARDYRDLGGAATTPGFLAWLADFARADLHDPSGDAVDLLTFHAAKGLEWPVVHLAGLEDGFVPIGHAGTRAARAEERRLLYVALTRARDELHLTWAAQRTFRDRPVPRRRSPFLDEIDQRPGQARPRAVPSPPTTPVAPPAAARPRRRVPDAVATADRPLYEALAAWRADQARLARMPATVIAHDRALVAIASRRPGDAAELAEASGLGPATIARYGDVVLDLVLTHGGTEPASGTADRHGRADGSDPADAAGRRGGGRPDGELADDPDATAARGPADLDAALRAWRTATATEAAVGAHRVLTDRALAGIVAARPADASDP